MPLKIAKSDQISKVVDPIYPPINRQSSISSTFSLKKLNHPLDDIRYSLHGSVTAGRLQDGLENVFENLRVDAMDK